MPAGDGALVRTTVVVATVLLLHAACTPAARPPTVRVEAQLAPPAKKKPEPPPQARCDGSLAHTRAVVEKANLGADGANVLAQFGRCDGGWSLALDEVCRVPEIDFDNTNDTVSLMAQWVVAHEGPQGPAFFRPQVYTVAVDTCKGLGNLAAADASHLPPRHAVVVFDWNGDGQTEAFFSERLDYVQDHPEADGLSLYFSNWTALLTFADGAIKPYAPAEALGKPIIAVRDVDGDGRPDAFVEFSNRHGAPWHIARAMPDGTFSFTDPAAVQATRAQCRSAGPLLVEGPNGVDEDASETALACAVLRGESGRAAYGRLKAECAARRSDCSVLLSWGFNVTTFGLK